MSLLTFSDVLLAKILAEDEVIGVRVLKRLLVKMNRGGGAFDELLAMGQFADQEKLQAARNKRAKYQLMMLESTIADLMKEARWLTPIQFKQLQRQQRA